MKLYAMAALLFWSTSALAQEAEKPKDETFKKAGNIASQPVRDIGLDKDEIPPVLLKAVENPYAPPPSRSCKGLKASLGELNAVLGEDFTVGAKANENRAGKIAEAVGKTIVNSLIPFRGLVLESCPRHRLHRSSILRMGHPPRQRKNAPPSIWLN